MSAKAGSVLDQFGGLTEGVAVLGTETAAAATAQMDAPADAKDAAPGTDKPTEKTAGAKNAKKKPKRK